MQYGFGRGKKQRTQPTFDAKSPRGLAICDGCGFMVQHTELRQKKDYRGGSVPVSLSALLATTFLSHISVAYFYEPIPYHCKILVQIRRMRRRTLKKLQQTHSLSPLTYYTDWHNG
jgi:hypothetical protein